MKSEGACFLCLDFETGGLSPHRDPFSHRLGNPILQYGIILLDDNLELIYSDCELVQPASADSTGEPLMIDDKALAVNNLDSQVCKLEGVEVGTMLDTLEKAVSLADDRPVVLTGSNPGFDLGFWQEAARQEKRKMPKIRRRLLDTYELNVRYLHTELGYTLRNALDNGSLPKFMKILGTHHQAHDALGDCVAVWKCLALHFKGETP